MGRRWELVEQRADWKEEFARVALGRLDMKDPQTWNGY
jgi:hypothetical protein